MAGEQLSDTDITYISVGATKKISVVSFTNAVKLLMLLPGKLAQVNRGKFARILHHYYGAHAAWGCELPTNTGYLMIFAALMARVALKMPGILTSACIRSGWATLSKPRHAP